MKVYNYCDGNGNQYKISADLINIIEYFPIKPYQSSSGVYDGGEYNKKRLDNEQFIQIESLIKTIFRKYQPKINNRRNRKKTERVIAYLIQFEVLSIKFIDLDFHMRE